MSATDFDLADRFGATQGTVAMTGIQAVLRVPLDRKRLDQRAGLVSAGLICGYRGSPLAGVDQICQQNEDILLANDIKFISGVNEDLGATAIWGAQMAPMEDGCRFDGVMGMWYGKGPGVDRSGDAFRHANTSGVHRNGGVLAVAGDDPECKSSTIPSASEWSLADQGMPVLFPGTVQEVLDFGVVGYALSRFCGSWVGFKINTNVADAYATVDTDLDRLDIPVPVFEVDGQQWQATQTAAMIAPYSVDQEEEMYGARLDAARVFMAAQNLDLTVGAGTDAKVGIVAAGIVYSELRSALARLGLVTDEDIVAAGVRIYKPAMIWPLEPTALVEFADGLTDIVVLEEKRAFVETQIRDLLYGTENAPRVVGKRDHQGNTLITHRGAITAETLMEPLRTVLGPLVGTALKAPPRRIPVTVSSGQELPGRSAYYCSGCPHNRSTVVPEGSVAGAGIGCHTMAMYMDRETFGVTQMGGEGVQWVGMAPFLAEKHRFQNLGDGTLAHSGYLAIRQAVAAGTNITYKILYNGTVAMTGGQEAAGEMGVPELTRALQAEGVSRIEVLADDPDKYDSPQWAAGVKVQPRDRLDEVQLELREVPGVTVLIYDQACAAELRRGRSRGLVEKPTTRVMIDEAICEGCGHCGRVSNCASVHPVETPFGRKTQIHQASCNYDLTCLEGNCPAFVTVEVDPNYKPTAAALAGVPDGDLPADPQRPSAANLVLIGIGGTGVVTLNQVLATAALMEGLHVSALDQTGLAQKGGLVVSNLRIDANEIVASNTVAGGDADTLLIFDLVGGASPKNLKRGSSDRTVAVVSTGLMPTGDMVSGRGAETFPELDAFRTVIDSATRADENMWLDAAGIAQAVFGSQPAANVMVTGVAYQMGRIPVSAASIEKAIEINGVAVQMNLDAFRLGRRIAADPSLLQSLQTTTDPTPVPPVLSGEALKIAAAVPGREPLAEVLAWRLPELIESRGKKAARSYGKFVATVRQAELDAGCGSELSETVARQLYKLVMYKDEYEVARLALKSELPGEVRRLYGPDAKLSYRLHPPTLKAIGLKKKLAIPESAGRAMFMGLAKGTRLRGRKLDPFGHDDIRHIERELPDEYRKLVQQLLVGITPERYHRAVAIAGLADQIRGYDEIKLENVANYRSEVQTALSGW